MENKSRVKWSLIKETHCKDCGFVFIPEYRGHFMSCFCSEPLCIDWDMDSTRIVGNADKAIIVENMIPCCISIALTDRQKEMRSTWLIAGITITHKDYLLHYQHEVEGKNV